jgi:hypothetical protein
MRTHESIIAKEEEKRAKLTIVHDETYETTQKDCYNGRI